MASPYLIDEPDKIGSTDQEAHSARLVLAVYTAVMASSRNEQGASPRSSAANRSYQRLPQRRRQPPPQPPLQRPPPRTSRMIRSKRMAPTVALMIAPPIPGRR